MATGLAVTIFDGFIAKFANGRIFSAFVTPWHAILAVVAENIAITVSQGLMAMITNPIG